MPAAVVTSAVNAPSLAATHECHDLPALDRHGLRLDRPGHYHVIISGDGRVHRLHATSVDLPAHTYGRNSNVVALSCACMGGQPDPWTLPPTPAQLESLCDETAAIATSWGWSASEITIQRVMTHAVDAVGRRPWLPPAATDG